VAEQTEISNVGGDGVASEVTLLRLVSTIEAWAKKSGVDPKAEAAKLQKLHNEAVKSGITTFDDTRTGLNKFGKSTGKATTSLNKFSRAAMGATLGALSQVAGALKGIGNELLQGGDNVGDFTKHIPLLGSALAPLAGLIDNSVESYRQLSSVGGNLGNSITGVRKAAAAMEMNMDEYSSFIVGNSEALRMLGGTVGQGQERFKRMNENIKKSGDFSSLKNLGFTVTEVNEGMADYIQLQRNLGTLEKKTDEELAAGSADYLKQIDMLARVTGMTRKEAEASLASQATEAGLRGMLNAFRNADGTLTQGGKNLQLSMGLLDKVGGVAGDAMKDMIDGTMNHEATGKFLAALGDGGPAVQEALKQIGQGADPQVLLDAFKTAGGSLEEFAKIDTGDKIADAQSRRAFIESIRQTQPEVAAALDAAVQMKELGGMNLKQAKEDQKKADATTKSMTTFEDSIKGLRGTIQTALMDSGLFEMLGTAMGELGDLFASPEMKESIQDIAKVIKTTIGEWMAVFKEGGLKAVWDKAIGGLKDMLGDIFSSMFSSGTVIKGLVIAVGALFAAKLVKNALSKSLGGIGKSLGFGGNPATSGKTLPMGGGGGGGMGGGGKAGGGGGLGKSIGGIGKGIGKGLGGILKGLAGGISAFANPAVVLGAAALGAAIVLIGGAIAGAVWMVGKSLPTMADGMKSFEELDGAKLISAGKGMGAIALGMAAFGAGSAISGLGSLVGGIAGGIGKLFGADDPLSKMEEFSNANIDGAKVKTNAEALTAFSTAMSAASSASNAGLSDIAGAIAGGIAGFFGATDPVDQLKKFGEAVIDTKKVELNAAAMIAFSTAMATATKPPEGVTSAIGSAIAGFFGATNPVEQLKLFGDTKINSAQVATNAGAMIAFNTAMSGAVTIDQTISGAIGGAINTLMANSPIDQLVKFAAVAIDGVAVKSNAESMIAFGTAMSAMPGKMPGDGAFASFGKAIAGFFGADTPFDQVKDFGDMDLNSAKVKINAEAMVSFGNAMSSLPTGMGEITLHKHFASRMQDLGETNPDGIKAVGVALASLGSAPGLESSLKTLKSALDADAADDYKDSIVELKDEFKKLNDEMAKSNKLANTRAGRAASKAASESSDQLNTTMTNIQTILLELSSDAKDTRKFTKQLADEV
tara:strand:+ start:2921 stop:6382 length:3462 start_codon:yes stop_codon:yes gene_type:complete